MQINGFQIDKYNQYSIPENVRQWTCPLCSSSRKKSSEKCMSVFWDTGLGQCNHCGERVQLHTYKKKAEQREYVKPKNINTTHLSDKVVDWFRKRGISQRTLKIARISDGVASMPTRDGFKDRNAIMFNYFRDGELINVKYRDGEKNFKLIGGAERIFYNLENIRTSKTCIIVEGEIDCLSFIEVGLMDVVSVPNGSSLKTVNLEYLDSAVEYFDNKDWIYLALDTDEAGLNTRKELIRRLGAERCKIIEFGDYKDANEVLVNLGAHNLLECYNNAKDIPIENVSSLNDWEKEYDDYLCNGMQGGYGIGKEYFDEIFTTYTGQFITVTGVPSHGKSDWVDEMCVGYNRVHGWKIAIASPENKPNVIHASKLEAKITGQWVKTREQISTTWHKKAKQYINDNFKFIDLESFNLTSVLEKTKALIRRFGIKVLVIDPFNKVRLMESLNKNITDYTNDYLAAIDEFARRNDILIILVAHPRKPDKGETKHYEPSFYDIKGGGEFYDMSPHGLLVYRDFDANMVKVKILKCKFSHLGETGSHRWFKWNSDNGRFSVYNIQDDEAERCSGLMEDNTNMFGESVATNGYESPLDFNYVSQPLPFESMADDNFYF